MQIANNWPVVAYYYVEPVDASNTRQCPYNCARCGTAIRHVFVVQDPETGTRAEIGSECVRRHYPVDGFDEVERDARTRTARRDGFISGPPWKACRAGVRLKRSGWVYLISPGRYDGFRASYLPPGGAWVSVPGFHDTVDAARAAVFDAAHPALVPHVTPPARRLDALEPG